MEPPWVPVLSFPCAWRGRNGAAGSRRALWRQAATAGHYAPLPEVIADADFTRYIGFQKRWSQELDQMERLANDPGDGRFYYSGMAQATLLDRLMPSWKGRAMDDNVWLEALLESATQRH
jgi:hypothetical protein